MVVGRLHGELPKIGLPFGLDVIAGSGRLKPSQQVEENVLVESTSSHLIARNDREDLAVEVEHQYRRELPVDGYVGSEESTGFRKLQCLLVPLCMNLISDIPRTHGVLELLRIDAYLLLEEGIYGSDLHDAKIQIPQGQTRCYSLIPLLCGDTLEVF